MEQLDFFKPIESKGPELVKKTPNKDAEVVDTGTFIKQTETSPEETVECTECGFVHPKGDRRCPNCGAWGK